MIQINNIEVEPGLLDDKLYKKVYRTYKKNEIIF